MKILPYSKNNYFYTEVKKQQFRFKIDYFHIQGIFNITGLVICSGHGYDFKTYCCKKCGELFVVEGEKLHHQLTTLETLCIGKNCPSCSENLQHSLVKYPENIVHNTTLLVNPNTIDYVHFVATELIDVYVL
jgi:hypothetical protein